MKKLQKYLLLTMLLFGNAIAALASNYGDVFNATRTDFRDESIYFIITTRFFDGDESNNVQCWDNQTANAQDPPWRGDFKGLIERLDYIKALGFTAVWITPVVENASGYDYHGYHAINFDKVDKRYESEGVGFQEVINAAHAKGMKIILDIVLNHSGNFGEENLFKFFNRDYNGDWTNTDHLKPYTKKDGGLLPDNYASLNGDAQHSARITYMKNRNGNYDSRNVYHHVANEWNWDDYSRWYGQIAGDCVDLNTENPYVSNYLVKCYGKFIAMGVDGFRIDTSGHISRLTFNKSFIPQFQALAEQHKAKRNNGPFFMFGEVCARSRQVTYFQHENASPYFYTWKESKDYAWDTSETSWNNLVINEGEFGTHTNMKSTQQQGKDYGDDSGMPTSNNHYLNGNDYHTPDHSKNSGFSVIDFPMHWNFENANSAWSIKGGDNLYNDATYNVVYVDSHDYSPDGGSSLCRFPGDQATWAENASLMFTFRGIPCIYYGSEIEFRKGVTIDPGPHGPLSNTGRAYYGGYITGDVKASGFAEYEASGNAKATLSHPLALHFQRLNQIRMAVPALRKGQYSTDNCSGSFAFKRRYTDTKTDSYALVCISGNATFKSIPNGKYTDVVTGDIKNVTNNQLSASCSGRGNLRVYVLDTEKTKAPGKVGEDGKYIYATKSVTTKQESYDGKEEAGATNTGGGTGGNANEPENPIEPCVAKGEHAVFFNRPDGWGSIINCYIWKGSTAAIAGWPGAKMTNLGDGNYKITLNEDLTGYSFIFNDGSNQTADLSDLQMSVMYDKNGTKIRTVAQGDCEAGEGVGGNTGGNTDPTTPKPVIKPGEQCIFFQAPSGWSAVHCYVWYGAGESDAEKINGAWPGKACENMGNGIFKFCFDQTIGQPSDWNVIFNNGNGGAGNQTEDLICKNAQLYQMDGSFTTVGIEDIFAQDVDVYAYERTIFVTNTADRMITVRSLDGRVLYNGTNTIIPVQSAGIYLVSIEGATLKVMVQ